MTENRLQARNVGTCECRLAVLRTFGELRARRMSEEAALESAARVFGYHHPEVPEREAMATVSAWIRS